MIYLIFTIPGSSKKTAINQKLQHPPKAPGPPVSMLLTIASQWPEQEWLFFWRLREALLSHNIEIGVKGCLTLLARLQVGWLFFLKNPDYVRGVIFRLVDVHLLIRANVMLYFPTTFACRCDLIKVPPATQYNVHVWTRASVMLYFRQLLHTDAPSSTLPPAMQQAAVQHPATLC